VLEDQPSIVALDAIVAVSAKAIDTAKDATKTIPIVMGFDGTTVAHRTEPPAGTPRRIAPTPTGPGSSAKVASRLLRGWRSRGLVGTGLAGEGLRDGGGSHHGLPERQRVHAP
jgi:hypothetical protein